MSLVVLVAIQVEAEVQVLLQQFICRIQKKNKRNGKKSMIGILCIIGYNRCCHLNIVKLGVINVILNSHI